MKTWNQLFIRHGWLLEEKDACTFYCQRETKENMDFLRRSLDSLSIAYSIDDEQLVMMDTPVSEKEFINTLDFPYRGRSEYLWAPEKEPTIELLDTYISGVVRQLNRLGFQTRGSCDGHAKNLPLVTVTKKKDINQLKEIFSAYGLNRMHYREGPNSCQINFPLQQMTLLDLAEKMSSIENSWVESDTEYLKKQLFYTSIENLLSIPGESGNERNIREFVKGKLQPFVDDISTDRHGNLLAEKTYKTGNGPTILLNAHLDTVMEISPGREIIKHKHIWSSDDGILGADDRAGVAVLLNIAASLVHASFNGKVKYIFTVEEECGLQGARKVDEYFLWGVDAAIVVDRRGNGDIVTSCGGYIPFCDEAYGDFLETVALEEGLTNWQCISGGSSDTRIWAEHGIQSVNLSVGYMNEHTEEEFLDVTAAYGTVKLIEGVFNHSKELRRILRGIRRNELVREII